MLFKKILLTQFIFIVVVGGFWVGNLMKFAECDFKFGTPLTCEIIHGVGIFPPFSVATYWFTTDKDQEPR